MAGPTIPGPHGTTLTLSVSGSLSAAIAQQFADELAGLQAKHELVIKEAKVKNGQIHVPHAGQGKVGLLIIPESVSGTATLSLAAADGFSFVVNEASGGIIVNATADPNILSTGTGSTTVFGGATGGTDVSANGNNLFQSLGSGGGQYFISFGAGNDTVWASSGNDVIGAGAGNNLIGLGTGSDWVTSQGNDTVIAAGNDTILALAGSNALVFGSAGSLTMIGAPGTSSTVIGGSGSTTLFDGGSSALLFATGGSNFVINNGGSDTIVAGSATVAAFGGAGGSINLFSAANGNVLVAGSGNETLNAGATSGSNSFWAGTGADSLIGGAGANTFGFVHGAAGGSDTIGNWTSKDTLALLGYGPNGITSQTTVGGSAVITLSDGTTITVAGVASIPSSHITLT